jgi:hypothetical protein
MARSAEDVPQKEEVMEGFIGIFYVMFGVGVSNWLLGARFGARKQPDTSQEDS